MYRPPGPVSKFLSIWTSLLEPLIMAPKAIILGDFNIHFDNTSDLLVAEFINLMVALDWRKYRQKERYWKLSSREAERVELKLALNIYKEACRVAKSDYFTRKISEAANSSRELFRTINVLTTPLGTPKVENSQDFCNKVAKFFEGPSHAEGRTAAPRQATRRRPRQSATPQGGEPTSLPTLGAGPFFPLCLLRPRQAGVASSTRPSEDSNPASQPARSPGGRAVSAPHARSGLTPPALLDTPAAGGRHLLRSVERVPPSRVPAYLSPRLAREAQDAAGLLAPDRLESGSSSLRGTAISSGDMTLLRRQLRRSTRTTRPTSWLS
ncbi:hypothetical protein NDU88_002235 [Pleurodeles waltl]|uniref:Endonuclease/exonuclease/phosphatase domain-containing protein n=1 Tax=Pleurodeles waltl TaxID=8319 RepID=A0AAV7LBZ9_PLEWA|nr:hypothetical protein NDU88_002235 [Pleurodeles waltl]